MSKRHMKRCSTLLIIREMQIRTSMRYHLTLVRITIIKKSTNNKCWGRCRENRALLHYWWKYKLVRLLWETFTGGSDGKESDCSAGDPGLITGLGRSSGEGNGKSLQYFFLENPLEEKPGRLQSMDSQYLVTTKLLTHPCSFW